LDVLRCLYGRKHNCYRDLQYMCNRHLHIWRLLVSVRLGPVQLASVLLAPEQPARAHSMPVQSAPCTTGAWATGACTTGTCATVADATGMCTTGVCAIDAGAIGVRTTGVCTIGVRTTAVVLASRGDVYLAVAYEVLPAAEDSTPADVELRELDSRGEKYGAVLCESSCGAIAFSVTNERTSSIWLPRDRAFSSSRGACRLRDL
jgi:hypothetical protein